MKIKVQLLQTMGGDVDVVNAARVSFANEVAVVGVKDRDLIEYLATGLRKSERASLISRMMRLGHRRELDEKSLEPVYPVDDIREAHRMLDEIQAIVKHWSPFSHVIAKFRMTVPVFVARQLHRSGVGMSPPIADDFGYSEESRRYISSDPEFYRIDDWRGRAADVKQGSGALLEDMAADNAKAGHEMTIRDAADRYEQNIAAGVAPELARADLPMTAMTRFIWTGSLYAWANLSRQRLDQHAQKESRIVACYISQALRDVAPVSWKALVLRGRPDLDALPDTL